MKIYIHTDLEGISDICDHEIIRSDHPKHRFCIERLMADVNAAVDGAFLGGADVVTVLDSHGGGGNFDLSLLDPRADLDTKDNNKWWGKLDESYDGTFFIGAHAKAGTINGFLDHTQSSEAWFNYLVNGRKTGELGQWAIVAGHFGVPMLMVSGDEAACAEAREFFGPIECVPVKQGVGRHYARPYDYDNNLENIKNAAKNAIGLVETCKPYKPVLPMEIILETTRSDYCDNIANNTGVDRIDARTVRKIAHTHLELFF